MTWYVLDKNENGEILLWSTESLDIWEGENVGWEDSELRKWLNNQFFNSCFSADEQSVIVESVLQNEQLDNESAVIDIQELYSCVKKANETTDRVFLMSVSELIEYMGTTRAEYAWLTIPVISNAKAKPDKITGFALSKMNKEEPYYKDKRGYFLRSSVICGERNRLGACEDLYYDIELVGIGIITSGNGFRYIRPAIWVKTIE